MESNIHLWKEFFDTKVKGNRDLVNGYLKYIEKLQSKNVPPIFELQHLSNLIGVEESFLAAVIRDSKKLYREFSIPKRRGGIRKIAAPKPSLLYCQRWVNTEILQNLPVHPCAFGFVAGRSAIENAKKHLGAPYLLSLDVKDFFPSIHQDEVMKLFLGLGYSPSVSVLLTSLCCLEGRLPQGAATSPAISNYLCSNMDKELQNLADKKGLTYTRYADDIALSGESLGSDELEKAIFLIELFGFKINEGKSRIAGPGVKKIVTGVSIGTGEAKLPRDAVRKIKADAYALTKFGLQQFSKSRDLRDPVVVERMIGRVEYWLQIEPENKTAQNLSRSLISLGKRYDNGGN
jgi:retron-type reverse transcriptase